MLLSCTIMACPSQDHVHFWRVFRFPQFKCCVSLPTLARILSDHYRLNILTTHPTVVQPPLQQSDTTATLRVGYLLLPSLVRIVDWSYLFNSPWRCRRSRGWLGAIHRVHDSDSRCQAREIESWLTRVYVTFTSLQCDASFLGCTLDSLSISYAMF